MEIKKNLCLVDTFLFFNELELLKVRLDYLGPIVKYFVISEANIDFSGRKKDFVLDKISIKNLPFSEKIIYQKVFINFYSPYWIFTRIRYIGRKSKFLWKIQDYQRNALLGPLKKFEGDYAVMFGDLDEIPKLETIIDHSNKNLPQPFSFEQKLFYYNLTNFAHESNWRGTIYSNLRYFVNIKPNKLRSERENLPQIKDGGWHLSYFMSPSNISKKINAIADVEKLDNKKIYIEKLCELIKEGKDIFGRDLNFTKISDPENHFPGNFLKSFNTFFK